MRVAVLATTIEFGGIERVLLNLFQHARNEIEFFPVLFTRGDSSDRTFLDCLDALGMPYVDVPLNASRIKYFNPIRNLAETFAIFRRQRFDLVHSHGYRADFISSIIARCFGLPVVSTCHGFISNDRRLSLYNRIDLVLLRYMTRIMAVSEQMKQELVAHGIDRQKIDVIANAVAAPRVDAGCRDEIRSRLGVTEHDFVFGYVGRLSAEKGVHDLLAAAARLARENSGCRVLIVGDGPSRRELERTAGEFGLSDRVHFAGFQQDPSVWYPAMDAFVLPSLTEGTPMALLEAMAHGLPVIATSVGGVPAVLNGRENGLLVPAASPASLLDAMRLVQDDPDLRARLSAGATKSVRATYDVTRWGGHVRDVYRATLRKCASQ